MFAEHQPHPGDADAGSPCPPAWPSSNRSSSPTRSPPMAHWSRPRLVIEAGRDSQVTVIERFVSQSDGPGARAARAAGPRRPGRPCPVPRRQRALDRRLVDRAPAGRPATATRRRCWPPSRSAATTPGCAPRRASSGPAARPVRWRSTSPAASRCTTSAPSRTTPRRTPPATCCSRAPCRTTRKSVYTGLIRIRENAKGTVAFQTNRNLTLSEGAWAESVPNLDIQTNDVKCSHASTVGPIDEEQRFYLESRGVRPEIAERLVVLGFFDEVLEQLPAGVAHRRAAPPGRRQAQHRRGRAARDRRERGACARSTSSRRARRAGS